MNEFYFIIRYIPFWAVPLFLMGGEFAYLFYMRKKKKRFFFCLNLAFISAGALVFYYWAGGPEKSVKFIMDAIRYYS